MTFRMIVQLWNTNTPAFVSCDADLTENYMYISMKFRTGVHVFCWEVADLIVRPSNQLAVKLFVTYFLAKHLENNVVFQLKLAKKLGLVSW